MLLFHSLGVRGVRLQCLCRVTSGSLTGQLWARGKLTQSASHAPASAISAALGMLAAKDAQLAAFQAAKDAQLASKDAQLTALQAAKDAQLASKDVQLTALQSSKDAQQAAKDALQFEYLTLSLLSQRDAITLAAALHASDVASGRVGVRSTLEVVIAELWKEHGEGKTMGATDRLQLLAKGEKSIPGLSAYVEECAKANNMDPVKALEMLPKLYRELSGPMHAPTLATGRDMDLPVEAVLNGNPTALLLVSCLFKLTRRDLRLYRTHKGDKVVLNILEPKIPPALAPPPLPA